MGEQDEIVREFLVEAFESLDLLDQELIGLEEDPTNADRINSIFRTVHTIKGTCGFLEFHKLESITHVGENLLDSLRASKIHFKPELATALLRLCDAIRQIMTNIETAGTEGDVDYSELVQTMTALNEGKPVPAADDTESVQDAGAEAQPEVQTAAPAAESENSEQQAQAQEDPETIAMLDEIDKSLEKHRDPEGESVQSNAEEAQVMDSDNSQESADVAAEPDDVANYDLIAELMGMDELPEAKEEAKKTDVKSNEKEAEQVESAAEEKIEVAKKEELVEDKGATAEGNTNATEEVMSETKQPEPVQESKPAESVKPEPEKASPAAATPPAEPVASRPSVADTSLRVDVSLLDNLMNLVGELVLARNQIIQFTKTQSDNNFINTCQRLNLITSELQESAMKTRMQPIANVWNKFPRIVRDVARACGKKIRIEMEGKDTDLDKTILEAIKDPLTHIVRNAADHGIESPDVRVAAGKSEEGRLLLRAFHEGGHVIIEISDDGGGLKSERIKQKAVEKGIITPAQADRMSEGDVNRLIFAAGFSTAEKVTNISGRGVGMDVVRSNIEKIGGAVDVSSQEGFGTTLKIKIPLTLAIVPALIVTSNEQRFAVPQVSLVELLRVEAENVESQVEEIQGALFYRLRGDLLPLVYLTNELGMKPVLSEDEQGLRAVNIVVVRADEREFGLVVDTVHDTEEIVVKPLGRQLKDIPVFAGATIMGDGKVALILDVMGLAKRASVVSEVAESSNSESDDENEAGDKQSLLLLNVGDNRLAVYLDMIDRLEEFKTSDIEIASGKEVVQYRGGIMPLIDLGQQFGGAVQRMTDDLHVVVFSNEGTSIGLIVDHINDIVEERVVVGHKDGAPGIIGSAVIQGKVTDLIDLSAVLNKYRESYLTERSKSNESEGVGA